MAWRWLFNPWVSVVIAVGTIMASITIYLLTGVIFVFFVLPIPIILWSLRKREGAT
jgi:uncharacterized membrane protein